MEKGKLQSSQTAPRRPTMLSYQVFRQYAASLLRCCSYTCLMSLASRKRLKMCQGAARTMHLSTCPKRTSTRKWRCMWPTRAR